MAVQACALVVSMLLILGGAYKGIPDFVTLGVSSIIAGMAMGWNPGAIALTIIRGLLAPETLEFAASVALIRILGAILQRFGMLENMALSLRRVLKSSRYAITAIPALLGSLSAFGGAIISAPLVDSAGDHLGFSPARRAAVNVVFRHSIFFVYPFSTTLLFTAAIAGISVFEIVGKLWPLAIIMFVTSYLRLVRGARESFEPSPVPYPTAVKEFLLSSSPVWSAILLTTTLGVRLVVALGAGVILALAMSRKKPGFTPGVLLKSIDYPSIATILGVMVFKTFIVKMDLLPVAMDSLSKRGAPLEVLAGVGIFVFAFVSGALQTGIAVTLPALLTVAPNHEYVVLYASFAYMIGFSAYLVSPLHLCQALTAKYFKVDPVAVFREYWPVPLITFLSGIALHLAYKAIL